MTAASVAGPPIPIRGRQQAPGLHQTDWSLPKTGVGYWLRTSDVGKGYASEAVNALRCGFRLEGLLRNAARSPDGRLRDTCLYARLPDEG